MRTTRTETAFVVAGVAVRNAVNCAFDAPSAAPQQARELEANSALDVVVTNADGLQYAPEAFERVFLADEPTI